MIDVASALAALRDGDTVDTGRDPGLVASIGAELAARLRDAQLAGVVCWVGDDESVLAHALAVELGVPVLRAQEDLGLLTLSGVLPAGARIALVSTVWGTRSPIASLLGLVRSRSLEPVVLASVLRGTRANDTALAEIVLEDG